MALVSMTGYADAQGAFDTLRWRWEVRSVNGRGFDLRLRIPPGLESIEPPARSLASGRFRRGNIQATLMLDVQEGVRGLRIDPTALASAIRIAREVALESGLAPARIDGLLALKGVVVQDDMLPFGAPARVARDASILESLAVAFDALARARQAEGEKLLAVLARAIDDIAMLAIDAGRIASAQPQALREKLLSQLRDLAGPPALAEDRIAQEVALLAVKADVREELDRLDAHVQEARSLLASGELIGRKLDFLSQELIREANTLCSKSSDIALTRLGLAIKSAIDQFREQAQNVE